MSTSSGRARRDGVRWSCVAFADRERAKAAPTKDRPPVEAWKAGRPRPRAVTGEPT